MTFKELIMNNDFNSLVPHLIKIDEQCEESLEGFESAFNLIRQMEPRDDGEKIVVDWSEPFEDEEPYICVTNLHNDDWEVTVARELQIDENVHLSDAALCAHCLWEITFWGFSPEEEDEHFRKLLKNDI